MNPTFTPTVPGSYMFQLVVNDGQANSAPASVSITVPLLGDVDGDGIDDLIIGAYAGWIQSLTGNLLADDPITPYIGVVTHPAQQAQSYPWCAAPAMGNLNHSPRIRFDT